MKDNNIRTHEIVLAGLYVASIALAVYRIIRTLDGVLSKAPEIPKDQPMEINAKNGWGAGIRAFINEQNAGK